MLRIARAVGAEAKRTFSTPTALRVLMALLLLDAVFLSLHLNHVAAAYFGIDGAFASTRFRVTRDGGFSEWSEYVKLGFCTLALAVCYLRTRQPVYAALAATYLFLLADNSLSLHERAGDALVPAFDFTTRLFGLAPDDIGEVAFLGATGAAIVAIAVPALRLSASAHRVKGGLCLAAILVLAFFGVGLDFLHALIRGTPFSAPVGLIEDSGELLVMSAHCAIAATLLAALASVPAAGRRPFPASAR